MSELRIKVISGGQTGADVAGLEAARLHGVPTGGTMPESFMTEHGPRFAYATLYNVRCSTGMTYAKRTRLNVRESDCTIRFAGKFDSRGEKCTIHEIEAAGKPHMDCDLADARWKGDEGRELMAIAVASWLEDLLEEVTEGDVGELVINVAGNSESTWPGCYEETLALMSRVLELLGYQRQETD